MRVWLGIQLFGAFIGALVGIMTGLTATTIFHQMLGTVIFGFAALTIAVIVTGEVAHAQAATLATLLREVRDAVREQRTTSQQAADAPTPVSHRAPPATIPGPIGSGPQACPACRHMNWANARTCTHCGVNLPPRNTA